MLPPRERWSLRLLFPPQEGVSDPFSHSKRENPVHPPNPLAQIPLAQRMTLVEAMGENTVRAEIITELILERAGPVIVKTF